MSAHRPEVPSVPKQARDIAAAFPLPEGDVGGLFSLALSEVATLEDVTEHLTAHPRVAARFVRLANCSMWGPNETPTLARAVQLVGEASLPYHALVVGAATALEGMPSGSGVDRDAWRRRAWIRAVAGVSLSRLCDAPFAAEALACGFLHEVGALGLANAYGEAYEELMDGELLPSLESEHEAFGFTRLDVNRALFQRWQIPAFLAEVQAALAASVNGLTGLTGLNGVNGVNGDDHADPYHGLDPELRGLFTSMQVAEETVSLFEGEDKGAALTRVEQRAARAYDFAPDVVYEFVSNLEALRHEAAAVFDGEKLVRRSSPRAERAEETREARGPRRLRDAPLPPELEHRRMLAGDPLLRDEISECPNRKAFELFLDREVQARLRGIVRRPLCCLVLSLDGWAVKHRRRGEAAANEWLRRASHVLARTVRKGDLYARLGGSYFGVCLSEADPAAMEILTRRLQETLKAKGKTADGQEDPDETEFSLSVGGAYLPRAFAAEDGRLLLGAAVRQIRVAQDEGPGSVALLRAPVASPRAA